jgi:outer membrane protein TolC
MTYRKILTFSFILFSLAVYSQPQSITLDECLAAAMKNHPLAGQNQLYDQSENLLQKNIDNGKLPQLNINGQATYQNEVIQLLFNIPGAPAPVIPKAQYKMSLDANQLIYGGGAIDAQTNIEDYNRRINQLNNDAELYKTRERVNQLYFGILLADMNTQVIDNTNSDLNARLRKLEASVREGTMLPSAVDVLQAEILKAGQRLLEVKSQKLALLNSLKVLTGIEISDDATFNQPGIDVDLSKYTNLRPEFGVFGLMQQKLEATKKLSIAKDMPKVYAFGTAGYGNPGYNFFKEGARFFGTVGAKLTWNFYNWNQTSREKQILDLNSSIIENQKNAYDMANKSLVQQYLADIAKADAMLKSDDEIITLRESITHSAGSQLENGTLTATDFVTEQLAEEQARLTRNLHQVQLLQSKALYKAATGGL